MKIELISFQIIEDITASYSKYNNIICYCKHYITNHNIWMYLMSLAYKIEVWLMLLQTL